MTPIPRSQDEITQRLQAITDAGADPYGAERSRLLEALDFDLLDPWFRPGQKPTTQEWSTRQMVTTEAAHAAILEYLPFAWEKANTKRGTSALRSLAHFAGLLWLTGDARNELVARLTPTHRPDDAGQSTDAHAYFGKTALVSVSEVVGFDWGVELIDVEGSMVPKPGKDDGKWCDWTQDSDGDFDVAAPVSAAHALGRA